MFLCLFTCLYVQIDMLRVSCHVSNVLFLFLLYVDVRVMDSHAWYHVYGYALLGSMCLYVFHHVFVLRYTTIHAYMFGFAFFHVYVLSFCMLTHVLHMLMPRSMFLWLDLRFHMFACLDLACNLCSACFIPSSMCLCTLRQVCVPRPKLCLSCHVLL